MKRKNIILILTITVVIIIILYGFQGSQNDPGYVEEIRKERAERERFMQTSSESPFAKKKDSFKGLKFYNPDPKYRIVADFTPIKDKKMVILATSDGKEERYLEYGYAEFDLDQFHNKLLILEMIDMGPYRGKLFLAFGDATSGEETYGAGRYLDVNKVPGGATSITLDFNKAYNPYCAYEYSFSCPLPPKENLLNVAIKAGEKNYE
jgi:uncharacterized protein